MHLLFQTTRPLGSETGVGGGVSRGQKSQPVNGGKGAMRVSAKNGPKASVWSQEMALFSSSRLRNGCFSWPTDCACRSVIWGKNKAKTP